MIDKTPLMFLVVGMCIAVQSAVGAGENAHTAVCQRPWTECHHYQPDPHQAYSIPGQALRSDILHGKPVRVTIKVKGYIESLLLDNINMNAGVICGESMDRISSPINQAAEQQPILVCTDGHVSFLNVSANRWDGNTKAVTWPVDSISFKTRDIHPDNEPVVSHYLDGSSTGEGNDGIVKAASKSELRGVMRDRGYSFNMDNTHFDLATGHVSGQSLGHVSQSYTNTGGMVFKAEPYHWLSSWDTSGRRDSSRFTVGDLQGLRHTNDYVALQWYNDVCWQTVYVHDPSGARLEGDIDMLKLFIRMGHRVRVHFDGFTLEANSLMITADDVIVAQTSGEMARRGGSGTDRTFFNTKTRQIYRLVHTTGQIQSVWFFIQSGKLSAETLTNLKVSWSVDTRPWTKVMIMNSTNDVIFGDLNSLKKVIATDNIRVKVEMDEQDSKTQGRTTEMFYEINNVRSPNMTVSTPEVVGQALKTALFFKHKVGVEYTMPLYRPSRQYLEVSTKRGVVSTLFGMDTKVFEETTVLPSNKITWFRDGGL